MNDVASRSLENGGDGRKPVTAASISAQIGGELVGDGDAVVTGVAPLDRAGATDISIFSSARYSDWYAETNAGLVLVARDLASVAGKALTRIVVDKPVDAMVSILSHFHRADPRVAGIHPTAVVSPSAVIGRDVSIEAFAVIGDRVVLGDRAWIGAHAFVGEESTIGADSRLHPSARVYPRVEIGARVVVHGGANIGREGFGWVTSTGQRVPHVGRCVLSDDVEIGANTCVDRGSIDDTIIGAGTKIDNLCQIAHNVRIGRMCFLASQVGIAGSARLEDGVQIGGQAGLQGHITVGKGAILGGQAGVLGDVPPKEFWSGYPARPHREQLRSHAAVARLVKLVRPLEQLLSDRGRPGDTE